MVTQQELELELGSTDNQDFAAKDEEQELGGADANKKNDNDDANDDVGSGVPVGSVLCLCKPTVSKSPCEVTQRLWVWIKDNKTQILSGITVALAQVPEAVSFSFVAGVSPSVGLQSAWIMGLATSWFGGRPGMVAGST